ncbi:alpha/beta-hydrolase [Echria macrotheca]|uniref:Alpha/beta-hydrolase n=1 Tax=Echria macrotheca TaxID=438768 RepID=A0AAJ0BQY0_9PEZI|nr:alpha/beta-hydrolase [Echria macrotheca]
MTSTIKPFTIDIPDTKLASLRSKLDLATFPKDNVPMADDWSYGVPTSDLKRLVARWRDEDGFDWRAAERKLNEQLPQFTTQVAVEGFGELEIHFVHQKSGRKGSIPLLFCHGWPGSFIEVSKILPLLTLSDDGPFFDVVAPSLPNFGFSEGPSKPGFNIPQYAECLHNLMVKLGYPKYVTQGGDWGYAITRLIGHLYPDACLASHLNYIRADPPSLTKHPLLYLQSLLPLSAAEKAGLERTAWFREQGYGYNIEQSTRPSTVGAALADSPVALLAWIYEKLHDWTDAYPWADDEILAWVCIYWFSAAGPDASVRIYYESQNNTLPHTREQREAQLGYNARVKLGLSYFPRDLLVYPRTYGRTLGPVVFEKVHTEGGHFAAYEKPELLAGDLRAMFGSGGGGQQVARVWQV